MHHHSPPAGRGVCSHRLGLARRVVETLWHCRLTTTSFALAACVGSLLAAEPHSTTNDLAAIPAGARILKIIHGWPDAPAAQDDLIRALADQGFGGVVCNDSFTDYLESAPRWAAFERGVRRAKEAGFALWLYDERGYPSAAAGGLTLRDHPEWQARGLLIADADTDGNPVALALPPGTPRLVAAYPVTEHGLDLAAATNLSARAAGGTLSWQPPAGHWRVLAVTESPLFEGTHVSVSLGDHLPYPNLLEREPTARFLELTHQRYAQHLGDNLGQFFISTFTDEPSLMSLFLKRMPYRVLPWSPGLPGEFLRRRGRALEPLLPSLITATGRGDGRARHEYWQTIGELVAENYFGQIEEWCTRHQILSGGHLLMEENPVNQVALYGDFFGCFRRMTAPGIDCLTSLPDQVPWYIARLAGSAADLEGRKVTMCETSDHSQRYRPAGDQRPRVDVTAAEIRGTCNRLIVNGINTINSYYSFAGLGTDQIRDLNAWVGRCCAGVRGGCQAADIAVVYPTESFWPRFIPSRYLTADATSAGRLEAIYHNLVESLFATGHEFTFVDARALVAATPAHGALVHGGMRWRVVILPGADTLPWAAWQHLEKFAEGGGVVVAIGALPANSETEFPSASVGELGRRLFGAGGVGATALANPAGGGGMFFPAGLVTTLPAALDRVLVPDFKAEGGEPALRHTHRRINGREVYFVINDGNRPWAGRVAFAAGGAGELCDPATGATRAVAEARDVPLELVPYGGALFRFAEAPAPRRLPLVSGPAAAFATRALPAVAPTVAHGEFVRADLTTVPADGAAASTWRVLGTLTKGEVDTFLFTCLVPARPLGAGGASGILLDTTVPPGQHTPAELLVVLHEKNGADYLASTGRSLGAEGRESTAVPFSAFHLAGWSKDTKDRLDPASISEVRVGWGGYFGSAGERVEFTLAPPLLIADP